MRLGFLGGIYVIKVTEISTRVLTTHNRKDWLHCTTLLTRLKLSATS